jgi:hypothetical protein
VVGELKEATEGALRDVQLLLADEVEVRPAAGTAPVGAEPATAQAAFAARPANVNEPVLLPSSLAMADAAADENAVGDMPANIRRNATFLLKRHNLRNGEKNWPFSRIFSAEFLRGVREIWLIEPYLARPHQRRNLREFLEAVTSTAKPKIVHVVTREISNAEAGGDQAFYDQLDRSFFDKAGSKVTYTIDPTMYDRFVVLDNGFVFKLGRGIDIYKPVAGLGGRAPELRQVRACEIDVFSSDEGAGRSERPQ